VHYQSSEVVQGFKSTYHKIQGGGRHPNSRSLDMFRVNRSEVKVQVRGQGHSVTYVSTVTRQERIGWPTSNWECLS